MLKTLLDIPQKKYRRSVKVTEKSLLAIEVYQQQSKVIVADVVNLGFVWLGRLGSIHRSDCLFKRGRCPSFDWIFSPSGWAWSGLNRIGVKAGPIHYLWFLKNWNQSNSFKSWNQSEPIHLNTDWIGLGLQIHIIK